MRGVSIALAVLGLCLLPLRAARAGVYNTVDPHLWPDPRWDFNEFRGELNKLRSIAIDLQDPKSTNAEYRQRVAAVREKERRGELTVDDRINLGCYLIRLRKFEE